MLELSAPDPQLIRSIRDSLNATLESSDISDSNSRKGEAVLAALLKRGHRYNQKTILGGIQNRDEHPTTLALALAEAPEALCERFYASVSSRTADNIKAELTRMGSQRRTDCENARRLIMQTARHLIRYLRHHYATIRRGLISSCTFKIVHAVGGFLTHLAQSSSLAILAAAPSLAALPQLQRR